MALNLRQTLLYRSTLSVYRASGPITNGVAADDSWSLVASGIPCHYAYTQNDSDPAGVGRIKRRTDLVEDTIHLDVATDIRDGDIVLDTTAGSPNNGTCHRIEGVPRKIPAQGARKANKRSVRAMVEEDLPPGILAGSGFLPTQLAGLVLWLRADLGLYQDTGLATPATGDGDPVGAWRDQSGSVNDMLQATAGKRPVLKLGVVDSQPVVRFDGISSYLSAVSSASLNQIADLHILMVLRPTAFAAIQMLLTKNTGGGGPQPYEYRLQGGGAPNMVGATGISNAGTKAPSTTVFNLIEVTRAGTVYTHYNNGGAFGTGTLAGTFATNTRPAYLGTRDDLGFYYGGDVAEVLMYSSAISGANLTNLRNYLNGRYALF